MSTSSMGVGTNIIGRGITTETATVAFQLAAGVFGGLAALVAARRLSTVDGPVSLGTLAVPVAVAGGSTLIGAFLLPTGGA